MVRVRALWLGGGWGGVGAVLVQAPRGQHGPAWATGSSQQCPGPQLSTTQAPWLQALCTPFIEQLLPAQAHDERLGTTLSPGGQGGGPQCPGEVAMAISC